MIAALTYKNCRAILQDDGRWECDGPALADYLNLVFSGREFPPTPSDPCIQAIEAGKALRVPVQTFPVGEEGIVY